VIARDLLVIRTEIPKKENEVKSMPFCKMFSTIAALILGFCTLGVTVSAQSSTNNYKQTNLVADTSPLPLLLLTWTRISSTPGELRSSPADLFGSTTTTADSRPSMTKPGCSREHSRSHRPQEVQLRPLRLESWPTSPKPGSSLAASPVYLSLTRRTERSRAGMEARP